MCVAFQDLRGDFSGFGGILGKAKRFRKRNQVVIFAICKDQIGSQVLDNRPNRQRIEGELDLAGREAAMRVGPAP